MPRDIAADHDDRRVEDERRRGEHAANRDARLAHDLVDDGMRDGDGGTDTATVTLEVTRKSPTAGDFSNFSEDGDTSDAVDPAE